MESGTHEHFSTMDSCTTNTCTLTFPLTDTYVQSSHFFLLLASHGGISPWNKKNAITDYEGPDFKH